MTTSKVEGEVCFQFNNVFYNEQVNKIIESSLPVFETKMKGYVRFNFLFIITIIVEIISLSLFFSYYPKSPIVALTIAVFFLTFFSYFILRIYILSKKQSYFDDVLNYFLKSCHNVMNYQEGIPEHHIALAKACCKFADTLHNKEYNFYAIPRYLKYFEVYYEKFSCWWHWLDVHHMKETLLITSVNENINLVKCEPTNLEVHASLANAYVMLSGLYVDPREIEGYENDRWIPSGSFSKKFKEKFRLSAERAIEELKILNNYAPNDPWIHAQLAYSYRDLQMPKEEIQEYEIIMKLNPHDKETLFKLGVLYFQQGLNAQGLKVYEELKRTHYKKAEKLIRYYGHYQFFN